MRFFDNFLTVASVGAQISSYANFGGAGNNTESGSGDGSDSPIDCKAVRLSMFPQGVECSIDMECPGDQMCGSLNAEGCEFGCVQTCDAETVMVNEATVCPGNYGFAYDCQVANNTLQFSVFVPDITTFHPVYDTRKISLISGEAEKTIDDADGAIKIFSNSTCEGSKDNGQVKFTNVVAGENGCEVGDAEKVEINGKMFDLWTFAVGFDDLWDTDPLGNEVIKRYGRHWTYQCAVQLEDYKTIDPLNVDGSRVAESEWGITAIPFEMKIFNDISFTEDHEENTAKDIGVLSQGDQKVYVQAKVLAANKFVHLGYCLVKVYDEDSNGNRTNEQEFNFIENGCLVDNPFIQTNFFMSDDRTSMSGSGETVDTEEFEVDLWDVSIGENTETKTYHFECQLMACDSLAGDSVEDYCQVDDKCPNRYSNLQDYLFTRRRRRDVSPTQGETVSADLVFSRNVRSSSEELTVQDSSDARVSLLSFVLLTITFLVQ